MLKILVRTFLSAALLFVMTNATVAAGLPTPNVTKEQSVNQIVAVVNDEIITQSELDHALLAAQQQFQQRGIPVPDEQTFKKQVLDQLIYQKLQLQLAKRNNVTASNEEVNTAIAQIAAQNRATLDQLKEKLTQDGVSYETFRDQIRKQIIIGKLQRQAIGGTLSVSKSEIAEYRAKNATQNNSAQYHVATVLFSLPDAATPEQIAAVKQQAESELKKLQRGTNFTQAINTHPGSSDLGWRSLNDLPQLFVNQVTKMKPGEVAGPVQAPNGFHVIKLIGKRQNSSGLTDQQIQNVLLQQKYQQALEKWLQQLRQGAYVRVTP